MTDREINRMVKLLVAAHRQRIDEVWMEPPEYRKGYRRALADLAYAIKEALRQQP